MLRLIAPIALLVFAGSSARAASGPPEAAQDTEADVATSRRHFDAGAAHYAAGNYRLALDEFLTAQRLHRVPAFDYNIGRCYDMLHDYPTALEYYERYLAADPPDPQSVRMRVVELKRRVEDTQPPPARPRKKRTLAIVLGVVGGAVVVGTAVALGVALGRPGPDYSPSTLGTTRVTP